MNNDEFNVRYNNIVERALLFSETARREGLLALEDLIDEKKFLQRDIFELGIRLILDLAENTLLDKILTNIINLEENNDEKILKNIQKDAVMGVLNGDNPRLLIILLNSHVNIGVEDAMKKFVLFEY
jgi:flagellar motor component MotA